MKKSFLSLMLLSSLSGICQKNALHDKITAGAAKIKQKVIAWRRDFHEHPELGNHETRTADIIARHLQSLGIEVKTGVAKTGVVGILKGGRPGPVVALRADMDGLPVTERVPLPFASKVKTTFNGNEVGVMHACGHDSHMAILMGVAEVLSSMKADLKGTVKFIFQPAEEGPPFGEEGGAELMVKEGVMENPRVDATFGLHISSQTEVGKIGYKAGGYYASVNDMQIVVKGRSAHAGSSPWNSIDPIVTAAEIINNLQTVVSRNLNVTENAGVVSIGSIHAGNRSNIIPETAEMMGTIRALDTADERMIIRRVKEIATHTAESMGAVADVKIPFSVHYPITYNDPALTAKMLTSLQAAAGTDNVFIKAPTTGAEDFSFYGLKAPALYITLGGMPKGAEPKKAPSHHTPDFYIDESGFVLGVKALAFLAMDYLENSRQ